MYLLTKQEQEKAMGIAHDQTISQKLRGYSFNQQKSDIISLDFSEVTSTFCPTQRRIYVNRVLCTPTKTSKNMALGSIEHATVSIIFNRIRIAQINGEKIESVLAELESIILTDESIIATLWSENGLDNIEKMCQDNNLVYEEVLPEFIEVSKRYFLAEINHMRHLHLEVDDFPVIIAIEEYVDGTPLGMNRGKVDALIKLPDGTFMIYDMKRKSWNDNMDGKTQIAGYALAMEKEYHVPISIGCLAFSTTLSSSGEEPQREIFPIDNNLRTEFITRRDRAIQIAIGHLLPPLPPFAEKKCRYCEVKGFCHSILRPEHTR